MRLQASGTAVVQTRGMMRGMACMKCTSPPWKALGLCCDHGFVRIAASHKSMYPCIWASWHWFRLMSDPHEQFCWTSQWGRVMLLRRAISLSSGGDDDDLAPHAMPLLSWEECRGTAHLHHAMWRTTDPVPLCLLYTDFFSNTPYPYCPVENAHCHRCTSPGSAHGGGRHQRGDTPLWPK
jgi:hypothetical protein